jgi:glycosyltransferase involved in cell wall biosynthesis
MLTRDDILPANHGSAVKIHRTALALSRLGCTVRVVTLARDHYHLYEAGAHQVQPFPRWLRLGPWTRWLRHRLRWQGIPVDEAFIYLPLMDWSLALRAGWLARRHGIGVYQAEFPGYVRPCLQLKAHRGGLVVLAEHNLEWQRIAAQHPGLAPSVAARLRRLEVRLARRCDRVTAVSDRDRDGLLTDGLAPERVVTIPLGVDLDAFARAEPDAARLVDLGIPSGAPVLVYHGTFRYPPNLEAVRLLATHVLPLLAARGLDPWVLAIGAHPPAVSLGPRVVFTGAVDRVEPYLKAATLAVVPLQTGGGTRMKVLDYFAAGLAVVSTPKGVEGLGLADGEQVLLGDSPDALAQAVARVLTEPALAERLGHGGRDYVARFDWSRIAAAHLALYREAADTRAGRRPA